ncbi:MAG: carboxypeptidase-like regulatory domain-containing protein, partial [Tannerella sp.]|nr:carboxypeptidase-like regulatory domain-containing protein [Tannerella sp.]
MNTKIVLKKSSFSLEQIIDEIENQSHYLFVYTKDVNIGQVYKVDMKPATLQETLDKLFAGTEIHYAVEGSYIVLSAGGKAPASFFDAAVAQQTGRRISGTVVDEQGEPVIGANVLEKGTMNGNISDVNGAFTLTIPENAILQISFIGYVSQEIPTDGKSTFQIVLREDVMALEE